MDGPDAARGPRARFRDLLTVILTARTDDIDIIAGLDACADDYLVKAFSLTVLPARSAHTYAARPLPWSPTSRSTTATSSSTPQDAAATCTTRNSPCV
jgi:DNA-binding response OmpR family regulator